MIVERKELTLAERLYVPAIANGFRVTWRHFRRTLFGGQTAADVTAGGYYPEVPWKVEPGYRGAPYLVRDQDGHTKCVSCQLCEFVCPPKAIRITPPGPEGPPADRPNAEKMPLDFEINMLRCIFCGLCEEVCPEEAIFMSKTYVVTGLSRELMIFPKEKLYEIGGVRQDDVRKWAPEHKGSPARSHRKGDDLAPSTAHGH
jgi:NADH-quinone oxidoreductase subunit I